jgi:tetratricopeptide (TPR) repeat protein
VLAFQLQQYGAALATLFPLYAAVDALDDFLSVKTCLLLGEVYLALRMRAELRALLNQLEGSCVFNSILKDTPVNSYFIPLMLGAYVSECSATAVNVHEYHFLLCILKARSHLLDNETEPAKKLLIEGEDSWNTISEEHYPPDLFKLMSLQKLAMTYYISAHVAYGEGNMNRTINLMHDVQNNGNYLLGDSQAHPSCQPAMQKITHPVYHFNNLACVHIRLGRPRLARLYLSKAMNTLAKASPVNAKKPFEVVSYHASQRKAEILYNSALALLKSHKPTQALNCLSDISALFHKKPLYWYRIAECYVQLHLQKLEQGRRDMISDVVSESKNGSYILPAKYIYKFQEDQEKKLEGFLEMSAKCLKNALSLTEDE